MDGCYYDSFRCHLLSSAISELKEAKIAEIDLPTHTGDLFLPLNVSVCGALKHWFT